MHSPTISTPWLSPALALLTLTLALGGGQVSRADMGHGHTPGQEMNDGHTNSHGDGHSNSSDGHHHGTLEIPAGQPVPTVTIVAHPDPVQGWNLEVQTTNFSFAPEQVNQANRPNAGHAHLYINGEKITRLYGPWFHLPSLPSGSNEITVGLNANGHEAFTHDGQIVESSVVVDAP
ncbi:MAG: hypothetical protein WBG38_01170 [Nodosilinea sp.]